MERHEGGNPARPGPTAVGDGRVADLAPEGMVGETIDRLGQAVSLPLFDRRHDARVEGVPSVLEEAGVGDPVGGACLKASSRSGTRLVSYRNSLACSRMRPARSTSSGRSATTLSSTSLPMTAAVCRSALSSGGSRQDQLSLSWPMVRSVPKVLLVSRNPPA